MATVESLYKPVDVEPLRLLEPYEFAGMSLPNRIVMPPMGTGLASPSGEVNEDVIAYYRRRAVGGVGMICVEASLISEDAVGVGPELRLHGRRFTTGLTRLVDAVHSESIPVGIQLWHPGRQTTLGTPVGPSAVPLSANAPTPRKLTLRDIRTVQVAFARSAKYSKEAGFDFVEIHAAHCYLPCEFLSPLANHRDDGYGGGLEARARFLLEIVEQVQDACGVDYPISVRLSGDEGVPGGTTVRDAVEVATWLERAGVAAISVSAGSWQALELTIPPMSLPKGCLLPLAAAIKRAVRVPVVAAGRIELPGAGEAAIVEGQADLIAVGRALIADPDLPRKLIAGRVGQIRPCISCNACVDLISNAEAARCAVNPEVGQDASWILTPAAIPQRVMVVGSGPSGLQAALVAAQRGHKVEVWERDRKAGGKLDVASRAPNKAEVLRFRDYQLRMLRELGVKFRLGVEVTPKVIRANAPDALIVATGANAVIPPIPGMDTPSVLDATDVLLGRRAVPQRASVAVIGGSATGCETAEFLLSSAREITIVEALPRIGKGVEQITRRLLTRKLRTHGVRLQTDCTVVEIRDHAVVLRKADGSQLTLSADIIIRALGWRPTGLELAAEAAEIPVHVVGDAVQPADFVAATCSGAEVALKL